MRPLDLAKNCADPSKLRKLGFRPKYNFDETLKETYKYWQKMIH
jgi:nucleoside-diphosphate-sugar epimerase